MHRSLRLSLFSLILLSACQSADPGPDAVPELAAVQVENWSGAAATVNAQVYGDEGAAVVATGTVSETGTLRFVLENAQTAQLSSFTACPGVTVSQPALKLNSFSAFDVTEGETSRGRIAQVSELEVLTGGLQRAEDYYVQYTYADREVKIEGRCQGGTPATFSYKLELKQGWNQVIFKLLEDGGLELSTVPVPADASWFFSETQR